MANPVTQVLRQMGWLGSHRTKRPVVSKIKETNTSGSKKMKTGFRPNREENSSKRRHKHMTVVKAEDTVEGCVPEVTSWSDNLVGIVVPSGCGKTTLANMFGWIDCDSLIETMLRSEVEERMYDKLITGIPWSDVRSEYAERCADTLSLMSFRENCPIMLHDHATAAKLGIQVVGTINYADMSIVDRMMAGAPEHRRVFARINYDILHRNRHQLENYVEVSSHEEVEMAANFLFGINGVAVPTPLKYGSDCPRSGHTGLKFAGEQVSNIDDLVMAEQMGEVPYSCVVYHLRQRGLVSYKGYGVTMDDWAKVLAKAKLEVGEVASNQRDWVACEAMNAHSLGHYLKMGSGADMDYLIERHRYADPRFLLNVLVHWKSIGVKAEINTTLLKLYGLPQHVWSRVHVGIRRLMIRSETFMGVYVSNETRQTLLDMHNLRFVTGSQIRGIMLDIGHEYIASHTGVVPHGKLGQLARKLPDAVPDAYFTAEQANIIQNHHTVGCSKLPWNLNCGEGVDLMKGLYTCREQISYGLAGTLNRLWDDVDERLRLRKICGIIHKIMTDWHRVVMVRDEWAQAVVNLLDSDNIPMAFNAIRLLRCSFTDGCSGEDWSVRVYKVLQRLIVGMLCADRAGAELKMVNDEITMEGVSRTQRLKALADINMPKHMLVAFGDEGADLITLINRLQRLDRSPTVSMMVLLFLEDLLPIQSSSATKIASMAYMFDRAGRILGENTVRACLSVYYKAWFGARLSERRADELRAFAHSTSGLSVPDQSGEVYCFRREFNTKAEKYGVCDKVWPAVRARLEQLGSVKHFSGATLVSDTSNPQTVIRRKRLYPEGDPVDAVVRIRQVDRTVDRVLKHLNRLSGEVSGPEVYGLVSPLVASIVDDVSSNPKIRKRVAAGLWYLLPSCDDDVAQANYHMRMAIDELADMTI